MAFVTVLLLVGMLGVSVLLANSTSGAAEISGIGIGVTTFLLFVASGTLGAGFGFLFGLPRSRFTDQLAATQATISDSDTTSARPQASSHYLTNSNLIKVSDWLTTIIIGLGLVNLGHAIPALGHLAAAMRKPLGGAEYAGAAGVSILISGFLASFLLLYLWTSVRVRELLEDSESQFDHMPSLEGMTVGEAKRALGTTSLKLVPPKGIPDDAHIAHQSVNPGTPVPRGAEVNVTVVPEVPVPDIRGEIVREAAETLRASSLTLVSPTDTPEDARISSRSPSPGQPVSVGTEVQVAIETS